MVRLQVVPGICRLMSLTQATGSEIVKVSVGSRDAGRHDVSHWQFRDLLAGLMRVISRQSNPRRRNTLCPSHRLGTELLEQRVVLSVTTLSPSKDNTLFEDVQGDVSDGAGAYFYVGTTGPTAGNVLRRATLAFDIANSIPAGSIINSATLTLHLSKNPPTGSAQTIELHSLLADWGQGTSDADGPTSISAGGAGVAATSGDATWLNRFFGSSPVSLWATAGGDFAASASATTSVNAIGNYSWTSATLITEVQGWLDNPASNFGWLIRNADEVSSSTARRFDSRENGTAANRPKLTIDFTPPPSVIVGVTPASIVENGAGSLIYTFTRDAGLADPLIVNFNVSGSATFATDYTQSGATSFSATQGTVSFLADEATKTVTVTPVEDSLLEPDESVVLTITSGAGYSAGLTPSASGSIVNDDKSVSITADALSHDEGDAGNTPFTFTVTRTGDTTGTDTVDYVVTGSVTNGADGDDFGGSLPGGTVTFNPGVATQTITVNVSGDTSAEADEGFVVTLMNSSTNLALNTATATATIVNDEQVMNLIPSSVVEGAATGTLAGTLSVVVPGITGTPVFSLSAGIGDTGNGSFSIIGDQLVTAAVLDFEAQSSYSIRVHVQVDGMLSADQTFTISVTDANDAPQLTLGTSPVTFRKKSPPVALFPNVQLQDDDTAAGFRLGGGQLALTLNAATNKKGTKSLDTIGLGGLSTIGTLTFQHVSPNQLQIQIQLLPGATAAQVQTFLRGITFSTKGAGLKKAERTVQVQVTDAASAVTNLSQTVNVAAN